MMKSLTLSLLISTGILSLALLLKLSIPLLTYQAPLLWISLSSWLKPPYLYLILNCIIITIAASSRFHREDNNSNEKNESEVSRPVSQKISVREPEFQFHYDMKVTAEEVEVEAETVVEEEEVKVVEEVEKVSEMVFEDKSTVKQDDEDEDELIISKSDWIPSRRILSSENLPELTEKPLVSSRFGHRKPIRASPEGGRALRVAKPKRHETLDNTWKMITEGRPMPLTRHLKKSETFHYCRPDLDAFASKKSETFKDRTNYQTPPVNNNGNYSATKLRKEPSLSQDELNKRVEAFIKKFNEEMRIQRQESLNQYKEMINRGSH